MFTPISTVSTAAADGAAPSAASNTRVAGRLLIKFASTAAITASAATNTRNQGLTAWTRALGRTRRRARFRTAQTAAPTAASQTGSTPNAEEANTAARMAASRISEKVGAGSGSAGPWRADGLSWDGARSSRNTQRKIAYSTAIAATHGPAISPANPTNVSPDAWNASRLVRFDTGSNSDAVFDRCAAAYTGGAPPTCRRRTAPSTTGVSSTTVASSDSTAVVSDATTKTSVSKPRPLPRLPATSSPPIHRNTPSASARWAISRIAARKPIVDPSVRTPDSAADGVIRPSTSARPAAGTAATASGRPHGRTTENANTASRNTMPTMLAATGDIRTFRSTPGAGAYWR